MDRFKNTYNILSKGGIQMRTKKRSQKMFIFGGTIGASKYPLYVEHGKKKYYQDLLFLAIQVILETI